MTDGGNRTDDEMIFTEHATTRGSRSTTLDMFRRACAAGETELHFQPIVTADGQIAGHECLTRWFPKDGPPRRPLDWIPGAERHGWITEVDRWVLHEAGEHLRRTAGHTTFLSVNIAADHFTFPSLPKIAASALEGVLDPGRLILEITESRPIVELEQTIATISCLRALGIRVAADDFGAGNTSIRALRALPLDIVKIDRVFTQNLHDPLDRDLLAIVLQAARHLELGVVLEGIETEEDFALARTLDIDLFQGYLFGHPQPWIDIEPASAPTI